jgi:hypothetical protein
MPKTPMDYSKCSIYKIEHIENESLVYVGHTTNFNKRKGQHKSNCYNEKSRHCSLKLYQMIRDNGGFYMFKMFEVEKYPCKDKREAERRENEIMKELKASMHTIKSFLTEEERKENRNEYLETNKEKIQEYYKEYYDNNKDYYKEYNKEYNETNKEKITQQNKKYREKN